MPIIGAPFVGAGVAPRVVSAEAESRTRVRVRFSEAMRNDPILRDPASYTLTPDVGSLGATITEVRPASAVGPLSVVLLLSSALTVGTDNYTVEVDEDLEDVAGNEMALSGLSAEFSVAAGAAAATGSRVPLIVIGEIEGLGNSSGPYRWCSRRPRRYPDFADRAYLPDLVDWPSTVEATIDPLGGVGAGSELTLQIGDMGPRGDRLTAMLGLYRRATTFLAGAVSRSATSITLVTNGGRLPNDTIYVGAEAMLLVANTGGTTWTVVRGQLDTIATPHRAGAAVLVGTPYLFGRRMRLFVGINDGRQGSADEVEIDGGWAIDRVALTPELGAWVLRGRSQLKYLDRLLDRDAMTGVLETFDAASFSYSHHNRDGNRFHGQFHDRVFFRIGDDEIRQADTQLRLDPLPVGGTRIDEWKAGLKVRQVYVARADQTGTDYGSFRYQAPGGETADRGTGTWVADSHAIVILLNLITGKAERSDYATDNYTPGQGNFSGLPPGVGMGWPAAEIRFSTFTELWHRTPDYRLDNFVLDASETARDVINRICRITGYELQTVDGQLAISMARVPLADETGPIWDRSVLVASKDGDGNITAQVTAELADDLTYGSVSFTCRNARGDEVTINYSDADFPEALGARGGLYSVDERPLKIDARYVRVEDEGGDPEMLRQRALLLLRLFRQAPWRYGVTTTREQRTVQLGSLIRLTHPQLPDLVEARRGVVNKVCKTLSKRENISRDRVDIDWTLISYAEGRFGRIAPTARIASVAGDVATVSANRFTDPQARGGLPATDAAAFTIGDRVTLRTRGGLPIATTPAYQSVVDVGANLLELDGDFGGATQFAAGYLLEYVGRNDAIAQQHERFVYLADTNPREIATGEAPWTWGEA